MLDIGLLHFEGRLRLIFQPASNWLQAKACNCCSSPTSRAAWTPPASKCRGYDAGQLDLQQLAQHGLLATQPPGQHPAVAREPSSWLMGLVGTWAWCCACGGAAPLS